MTISFLTGAGNETTNVTTAAANNLSCNKPANVADGDLLVAQVIEQTAFATAGHVMTAPSGWTLASAAIPNDTRRVVAVFVKYIPTASSESATSYNFSASGGETGRWGIKINRVTGCDSTTQIDVSGGGAYSSNTTSGPLTVPGLTTVTDNAVMLIAMHIVGTQAQSPPVVTDPSGWTRYTSMLETTPGSTGSDDSLVSLIKTQSPAGAQANVSISFTPGQSAVIGVMIALRPGATTYSGAAAMTSTTALAAAAPLTAVATAAWGSSTALAPSATEIEVATAGMTSPTALASAGSLLEAVTAAMSSVSALTSAGDRTTSVSIAMTSPTAFADTATLVAVATVAMVSPTSFASSDTVVVPLTSAMSSVSQMSGSGSAVLVSTFTMTSTTALNPSASRSTSAGVACTSITSFGGAETLVISEALAWLSASNLASLTNLVAVVATSMLSTTAMTGSSGAITPGAQSMTSISALAAALTLQGPEMLGMTSATAVGISATASYLRAVSCISATALGASGSRSTSTDEAMTSISALGSFATLFDVVTGAWISTSAFTADGVRSNVHACTLEMVSVTSLTFDADIIKKTVASVLTPVYDEDLWVQAEYDPAMYVWLMRQQGLIMPTEDEVEPPLDWIEELPLIGMPDLDCGAGGGEWESPLP
jgi:hypothetical protein